MILNILNYLIVIATLFFGYRIYISRKQGKKFTEIKPLLVSFFACIVLLWAIMYLANLHTSFLCNLIYPTFSRILLYSC